LLNRLTYALYGTLNTIVEFVPKTPAKSSKVSKDSDFSLLSNKDLSKLLLSSGLGLGQDEVGQKDLKLVHLRHYS